MVGADDTLPKMESSTVAFDLLDQYRHGTAHNHHVFTNGLHGLRQELMIPAEPVKDIAYNRRI